jgi:GT2 family glycosyltransferase
MSETSPIFSIIIVNYNAGDLLENCIASIKENIRTSYEIIVYDNASSDNSIQQVQSRYSAERNIIVISGPENLGFAKGNNNAAQIASGQYLHFLNPDILVNSQLGTDYETIVRDQKKCVYVTSLTDENGRLLKNRHLVPLLNNYYNRLLRKDNIAFWNIGASLIIPRDIFLNIGGWPEDYFMYSEDLDLFYTLFKNNVEVKYIDTRLLHIGKGTTRQVWTDSDRALIVEMSFKRFYRKHGFFMEYYVIRPILLIFILFNEPGEFILQVRTFWRALFTRTK